MRVIAVGDDDQNIFEFRGSSSKYLHQFIKVHRAVKYELPENYRSKKNLVEFSNQFVKRIGNRLKTTTIIPKQTDPGKIKLVRYQSDNLITPFVHDILTTGLTGTTCVLTKTNEEALQVTGLLLKNGMQAKLIQTNDGFSLYNLAEVRYFLDRLNSEADGFTIHEEAWQAAKTQLLRKFGQSEKLEVCLNIIKDFEATNPKTRYKSDLEAFIRESRLDDFLKHEAGTILVSTIHKAKGKEFDNVFLLLEKFNPSADEAKRLLYVALTRAKNNLTIHVNSGFLDNISAENLERITDHKTYLPPKELVMHLTYKDVWLDFFLNKQYEVSQLKSGDALILNGEDGLGIKDKSVLKFSRQFVNQIESMKANNYELKAAKVNFIVYWLKEETKQEIKIILPELYFEKVQTEDERKEHSF